MQCIQKIILFNIIFYNHIFTLQKPPVKTTTGVLECPVGITRLYVAKLFTTLMATENVKVYEALVELGTFQTLLVSEFNNHSKFNVL